MFFEELHIFYIEQCCCQQCPLQSNLCAVDRGATSWNGCEIKCILLLHSRLAL